MRDKLITPGNDQEIQVNSLTKYALCKEQEIMGIKQSHEIIASELTHQFSVLPPGHVNICNESLKGPL